MSFQIYNAHPNIWIQADGVVHNLSLILSLQFNYVDTDGITHEITVPNTDFITQTTTRIVFLVPDGCDFLLTDITVSIVATIFSGTVVLGPNAVILTDGSGIYRLIPNQAYDTLYVNTPVANITANVKIPDPTFKTRHIGG